MCPLEVIHDHAAQSPGVVFVWTPIPLLLSQTEIWGTLGAHVLNEDGS